MNKLSYGLLSLLSVERLSGYDLTQKIKLFWHTNHSAVYPILSVLEERGLVEFSAVPQKGKPDKKIYETTPSGMEELKKWVSGDLGKSVKKDELTLKMFCLENLDRESVFTFLDNIEKRANGRIERLSSFLNDYRSVYMENGELFSTNKCGSIFIVRKGIEEAKIELQWCSWIREMKMMEDRGEKISREMLFDNSLRE